MNESYTVRAARLKMEATQRNGGQGFQEAEIEFYQAKKRRGEASPAGEAGCRFSKRLKRH